MAIKVRSTGCCGLRELDQLGTEPSAESALLNLRQQFASGGDLSNISFLLFTGVTSRSQEDHTGVSRKDDYGAGFASFIHTEGLGGVVKTEPRQNPKTRNWIACWLWTPDQAAIGKWFAAHPVAESATMGQSMEPGTIVQTIWDGAGGAYLGQHRGGRPLTIPRQRMDTYTGIQHVYMERLRQEHERERARAHAENYYLTNRFTQAPADVARLDGIPVDQLVRTPDQDNT